MKVRTVLIFGLLIWEGVVFASIPPSEFILKSWLKKHIGNRALRIRAQVTAVQNNGNPEVSFKETFYYHPGTKEFRSWATDHLDKKLYFMKREASSLPLPSLLLLSANLKEMTQILKESGIPILTQAELPPVKIAFFIEPGKNQLPTPRVTSLPTPIENPEDESLVRIPNGFAWVIGSKGLTQKGNPQVWFKKDRFEPVRLLYSALNGATPYDFSFEFKEGQQKEFPYPQEIKVAPVSSSPVFIVRILEVAQASDPSKSSHLNNGYTEVGSSASSEVKDLIQLYYGLFR